MKDSTHLEIFTQNENYQSKNKPINIQQPGFDCTIISNSDLEVNDTETLPVTMKLQLAIEASLKSQFKSLDVHHKI